MNRERVFGLETEYGVSLRKSDGTFLHAPGVRGCFFSPIHRALFPVSGEDAALSRTFALVNDSGGHTYWVGASGGELYRDQEVIEYATPECMTLAGITRAAACGDRIVWELSRVAQGEHARRSAGKYADMLIVKNNSDAIGGSFLHKVNFSGSHENYQIAVRLTRDSLFSPALASCLVMRMLFAGGGGLVRGRDAGWQYVISPRALATNMEYCAHITTKMRPMVSYRGTPYSSLDRSNCPVGKLRLHIAMNDSTMRPDTIRFRFGIVSILLRIMENHRKKKTMPVLQNPIRALQDFSRDSTLTARAPLDNGEMRTLPELCRDWLEVFSAFDEERPDSFSSEEKKVLKDMRALLRMQTLDYEKFLRKTEWGLKLSLLSAYCRKRGIDFGHQNARGFDGYYSNIGPDGFYHKWEQLRAQQKNGVPPPFSDVKTRQLLAGRGLAPRALLRKRHLQALAEAGCRIVNNDWGFFELSSAERVEILNPMQGGHAQIEADIALLKRGHASKDFAA